MELDRMYGDLRYRRPRGACLFRLSESLQDAKVSLHFAGVELAELRRLRIRDQSAASRAFEDLELEFLDEGRYVVFETYGFYEGAPVLIRLYCDERRPHIVRYVAILAYRPRVLKTLASRLEKLGWSKMFLFEIEAKARRAR